jgi:hypothetical protein
MGRERCSFTASSAGRIQAAVAYDEAGGTDTAFTHMYLTGQDEL